MIDNYNQPYNIEKSEKQATSSHTMSMVSNLFSIPFITIMFFAWPTISSELGEDGSSIGWFIIFGLPIIIILIGCQIGSVVLSIKSITSYVKEKEGNSISRVIMNLFNIANVGISAYVIILILKFFF